MDRRGTLEAGERLPNFRSSLEFPVQHKGPLVASHKSRKDGQSEHCRESCPLHHIDPGQDGQVVTWGQQDAVCDWLCSNLHRWCRASPGSIMCLCPWFFERNLLVYFPGIPWKELYQLNGRDGFFWLLLYRFTIYELKRVFWNVQLTEYNT